MRSSALALLLLAAAPMANGAPKCAAPGDPVHWRADYCMLEMETDDEIAISDCMEREGKRRFRGTCASNLHFKQRMCEALVRQRTVKGPVARCIADPAVRGRTVRNGGVGS